MKPVSFFQLSQDSNALWPGKTDEKKLYKEIVKRGKSYIEIFNTPS